MLFYRKHVLMMNWLDLIDSSSELTYIYACCLVIFIYSILLIIGIQTSDVMELKFSNPDPNMWPSKARWVRGWLETKRPPTYQQGKSRIQIFSWNEWYKSETNLRPIVAEKKILKQIWCSYKKDNKVANILNYKTWS